MGQFYAFFMTISQEQSALAYSSWKGDSWEHAKKKKRDCLGFFLFEKTTFS